MVKSWSKVGQKLVKSWSKVGQEGGQKLVKIKLVFLLFGEIDMAKLGKNDIFISSTFFIDFFLWHHRSRSRRKEFNVLGGFNLSLRTLLHA